MPLPSKLTPAAVNALASALLAAVLFQNAHGIVTHFALGGQLTEATWLSRTWPYLLLVFVGLPLMLARRSKTGLLTVQLLGFVHGFLQLIKELALSPQMLEFRLADSPSVALLLVWTCYTLLLLAVLLSLGIFSNKSQLHPQSSYLASSGMAEVLPIRRGSR